MDFTVDSDKFSHVVTSLNKIYNDLDQYVNNYDSIINELSPGWKGLSKQTYFDVAIQWRNELCRVMDDMNKLKDVVQGLGSESGDLLERGKKLKI